MLNYAIIDIFTNLLTIDIASKPREEDESDKKFKNIDEA